SRVPVLHKSHFNRADWPTRSAPSSRFPMTSPRRSASLRNFANCSLIALALVMMLVFLSQPLLAQQMVQPPAATGPRIWLQDNQALAVQHRGDPAALQALASGQAQPLALAKGDLDADGVEDLVVGYAAAGGGVLAIHRGNRDAFAPQSDASFWAISRGEFPAPFLPNAAAITIPVRPDFVAVGSYNGRGFLDLIVAARGGGSIYLLSNDGHGNFSAPQAISVGGPITALAAGDFGGHDIYSKLLVGISNQSGSYLMAYAGTLNGLAGVTVVPLKSPVLNILFGEFGGAGPDAVLLSGGQVALLHSSSLRLETVPLPVSASGITLGVFIHDRNPQTQIAVLGADGRVHIVAHNEFDPRPYTADELAVIRKAALRGHPNPLLPGAAVASGWKIVESFAGVAVFNPAQPPVLLRSQTSANGADDVMVLNPSAGQLVLVSHSNPPQGVTTFVPGQVSTRPYAGAAVAALAMRANVDSRPGILALHQGQVAPAVL